MKSLYYELLQCLTVLLYSQVEARMIRPNLLQSSKSNAKSKPLFIGLYYGRPRVLPYSKQNTNYINLSSTYTICYVFQIVSTTHLHIFQITEHS